MNEKQYEVYENENRIASNMSLETGGQTKGRLIDAEEFKNHIKEVIKKQNGKNIDLVPVGELLVFIDGEPTAYDLDEVVKQLEEACISPSDYPGFVVDIEKAIEIVKVGGVDDKGI